jgi:hypothetical protein
MLEDWREVETSLRECLDIISQFPDEPTAPEVLLLVVFASSHKRFVMDLELLSISLFPRVLAGREETPSVILLSTALAEGYSSSSVEAIGLHLFGG